MSGEKEQPTMVDYVAPPVQEVVFGTTFRAPPRFTFGHVGRFWQSLGDEYVTSEEHPPILAAYEKFDDQGTVETPPPFFAPRLWLVNQAGDHLMQIQRDRFLCNWRRANPADPYPRYDVLSKRFQKLSAKFNDFVQSATGEALNYEQYELAYVNHIEPAVGWNSLSELGSVFPDLDWKGAERFLPSPESINVRYSFQLPQKMGRLHVRLVNGRRPDDGAQILILELTARGFHKNITEWFDLGHEWIVRGFADLTNADRPNTAWGRKA